MNPWGRLHRCLTMNRAVAFLPTTSGSHQEEFPTKCWQSFGMDFRLVKDSLQSGFHWEVLCEGPDNQEIISMYTEKSCWISAVTVSQFRCLGIKIMETRDGQKTALRGIRIFNTVSQIGA